MAIVYVKPTADNRHAEEGFATDWTDINIYRLSFEVKTSAPSIGGQEVLASGLLPARASTYASYADSDVLAWCRRRFAYQNPEDKTRWMVVCEFSSEFVDPLNEPPIVRWITVPEEMPYLVDVVDEKVLNSALDPFDPTPTRTAGYDEITIVKNFSLETFDPGIWTDQRFTINAEAFTVPLYEYEIPVGHGFLRGYQLETFRRNMLDYVRATATIWYRKPTTIRPDPWHDYIPDMGFRELTAAETKVHIVDFYGHPVSRPALLNGLGAKLPLTDPPVHRDYQPYLSADWNDLEIGA